MSSELIGGLNEILAKKASQLPQPWRQQESQDSLRTPLGWASSPKPWADLKKKKKKGNVLDIWYVKE